MRQFLRWSAVLALIVALVAVGIVGCSSEEEATPTPTQPLPKEAYKVGAVFSTTGPASHLGTPEKQTVEMMVEQINDNGGINGRPLEVIIYDTETNHRAG